MSRSKFVSAGLLLTVAGLALAGPLTPPSGPVAPTMKTLTEVEPRIPLTYAVAPGDNTTVFKITGSANYYLTGDVFVPPGYNGITVATGGVTIDLNGFTIYGVQGSHEGVTTTAPWQYDNVILKNGRLTGLGTQSVNLSACYRSEVHNIRSEDNGGSGIQIGPDSVVTDCAAKGLSAYVVGDRCRVSRCTANAVNAGFTGSGKDAFENCTASGGTMGFSLGSDTTVRDCVVVQSTLQGIAFQSNCTITGNQCRACGGTTNAAIWGQGSGSTIQNNQTTDGGYGVWVDGNHNTISGNTFSSPAQRAVEALGTNNLIIQNTMHNTIGGIQAAVFNRVGAILQPNFNPQLISGTSGGGLGITDPYANLLIN